VGGGVHVKTMKVSEHEVAASLLGVVTIILQLWPDRFHCDGNIDFVTSLTPSLLCLSGVLSVSSDV
jgi:hypothetical protein